MRFMVMVKTTKEAEGAPPDRKLMAEMGKFNQELVKAGVLLMAEGLKPSSQARRVVFSGTDRTVLDGPYAETKELLAGFWLWQLKSMDEAVEWVKRCPGVGNGQGEIEIRPLMEMEDFAPLMEADHLERRKELWEKTK